MKKLAIISSLIVVLFMLTSCTFPKELDQAYISALEALLENHDFEYSIGYISLFINDESISTRDIEIIKKYFQKTYEKKVFTYTPDEVKHAGPYGKENLNMDGMFLYILEINEEEHMMSFETAKYHTIAERGSLGMEVVLRNEKSDWVMEHAEVLWRE